jgi:alkylation response protein AidB-like acyl-CoA dehydrogenase
VDFNLSPAQLEWQSKARGLGHGLAADASASDVMRAAAAAGLLDFSSTVSGSSRTFDLFAAAVAVEAMAYESSSAGVSFALHAGVMAGLHGDPQFSDLERGEAVGAIALSSDDVPAEANGRLSGRAAWVTPLTALGVAVIGMRSGDGLTAAAVSLNAPGVLQEKVETAALIGLVCGHIRLDGAPFVAVGPTMPFMSRVRILLSAAGLGMGRRALREALHAAHGHTGHGAGGEQTVQGLLADAATELEAAMLLTWKAAAATQLSLADASMAKLAATEATQRAVARATQVVGADSFRRGHVVERLAQDARTLELFAGRTEALRDAVAIETLPRGSFRMQDSEYGSRP